MTERLKLSENYYAAVFRAAEILKDGGIVAIPTETVYGLAASAFNDEAIGRVFEAKGRPQDNPLIVHISDIEQLAAVAKDVPQIAFSLAERFWPGPLTMVLPKGGAVCESVSRGLNTVAVRMPSDRVARDVIAKCGLPLAAPSANLSGYPSPTKPIHVLNDLDGKIDAVLMGGECSVGLESTVVSLIGQPRLLRPGAVTAEQLKELLPNLIIDKAILKEVSAGEKVSSPGMKHTHYSPKTPVYLVEGSSEEFCSFVNSKENSLAVAFSEDKGIEINCVVYGSGSDEKSLAHNVFSILRSIDRKNYAAAYIHAPSKQGVGLAVYNRLIRAAGFKVIKL